MHTLTQVVLTTLAAFLGTWIAAGFAFVRFRDERAFERRMRWYEEAAGAARQGEGALRHAAHLITVDARILAKGEDRDYVMKRLETATQEIDDRMQRLREFLALQPLYAPALDEKVQEIMLQYARVGIGIGSALDQAKGGGPFTSLGAIYRVQGERVGELRETIVAAGRVHLESHPAWWRFWT